VREAARTLLADGAYRAAAAAASASLERLPSPEDCATFLEDVAAPVA
jgi:UDP:flavonoid glycosyltransferase YjiC (YdhE family)